MQNTNLTIYKELSNLYDITNSLIENGQNNLYINVYSSFSYNCQNVKAIQMAQVAFIHEQINTLWFTYTMDTTQTIDTPNDCKCIIPS